MIKPEQIPDECFDAAMTVVVKDGLRAAIAAALNAWPGKEFVAQDPPFYGIDLILPLPQEENPDA